MAGLPMLRRLPGRYLATAAAVAMGRTLSEEWRASDPHRWLTERPRPEGFALQPVDRRPTDPDTGRLVMAGTIALADATMTVGVGGNPWDRACPTRAFAEALHNFAWLPDLVSVGPDGAAEALRLVLEWRRLFGRWNSFAWDPEIMARRVFHLACAGPSLTARASDTETLQIAADLARQARDLLGPADLAGAADRAVAAAVAGVALSGSAGERLLERALVRLSRALPRTVAPDGGHASRQASAALELLFGLETLDEAMIQRGMAAPDTVQRAIDRLAVAVRFFTLADGSLAAGHGGLQRDATYVAAARALDEAAHRPMPSELGGYQRMESRRLQVIADTAPPPTGPWSLSGAASPLAIQVLAGGRRLIDLDAGRSLDAASTVQVEARDLSRPITGLPARVLGPRLAEMDTVVEVQRHEAPGAVWLDLAHHGWNRRYGLMHQRRLYLDLEAGDLRGEDRLTPTARAQGPDSRHFVAYTLRFQLHPGVRALVAQDRRSVLLRADGVQEGWVLRNDVLDIAIEPVPRTGRPALQLVLSGLRRADSGARVRWRLSPARTPQAVQPLPSMRRADLIDDVSSRVDGPLR